MSVIREEISFAQKLGSNQVKIREKAVRSLGKYFKRISTSKDSMSEESMMKLWKGIFYYFWNCDKPLFQEERADILSKYIHVFQTEECAFLYLDTFLQTMAREWFTIDRYRLEKFMMLVRKFLYESFVFLKNKEWDADSIKQFKKVMKKTAINTAPESAPLGLKIHIAELYTEELAKVGSDELPPETVKSFLVPFCNILTSSEEPSLIKTIAKDVFIYLINQDADEDEFQEFPLLKFDVDAIQDMLMKYASKPDVRRKNMKVIYDIVKQFEDYKNGISKDDRLFADQGPARKLRKRAIEKAAMALVEEEMKEKQEKLVKRKKAKIIDL